MSAPFQIYVVACRPCTEKVIGGGIGSRGQQPCDGTFFLDEDGANNAANWLNARDGLDSWKVYPALLTVEKESA